MAFRGRKTPITFTMDSQATLINIPSAITLVFDHDNVTNATLLVNSKPLYTVATESLGWKTQVNEARTGRMIASIRRRDILPDSIMFPERRGGKSINISKWLKKSKHADGLPMWAMETETGRYIWKTDPVQRLALFSESDLKIPLAYLQPAASTSPLSLVLEPGTGDIRDYIIVSVLLLERKLRIRESLDKEARDMAQSFRYSYGGLL